MNWKILSNSHIYFSEDVRSSLDLLDGVIGEFDDGLTSSAESEANHARNQSRQVKNGVNQRRGGQREEKPVRGGQRGDRPVKPELKSSHLSINEQIDDIFSQLTEEIYLDEKQVKENKIKLSRSPTRNRNDPLPRPPTSSSAIDPPPINRKIKPSSQTKSNSPNKYRSQENKTLTNDKPRPKLKNPGVKTDRQNYSLPNNKLKNGNGEVILYEDHDFSRNNTFEKVIADVHKTASATDYSKHSAVPPPMPEKQKIHLKNSSIDRNRETSKSFLDRQKNNLSSQEAAVMEELKAKVSDKQGKISKFDNNRNQPRGRSKQRDLEEAGNLRPRQKQQQQGRQGSSGLVSPSR